MSRRLFAAVALATALAAPAAAAPPTCLSDHQCADGDLCNGIERCVAGTCAAPSAPLACDDGDPCTVDACDPGAGCAHADEACPATCGPGDDGLRCSDGSVCTRGDTCSGGSCVGTPLACGDGDPCTSDACDPTLGCVYLEEPDPPACLSSSECVMAADLTPCAGDGDPCTVDGCLEGACRVGLNLVQRQCADGDACNGEEFCSPVKGCQEGPAPVCDDGELCNGTETCAPATGCVGGTPASDGTPCTDGRECTTNDDCNAGTCVGVPLPCADGDGTTVDLCLEGSGCLHCAALAGARLAVRFPSANASGRLTASGRFVPGAPFAPAGPEGAHLILHDGSTVVQAAEVPGAAFVTNGRGTVATFVDRSGTLVPGLARARFTSGPAGTRHRFAANGHPLGALAPQATRGLTVRAGAVCATAVLSCATNARGTSDRCK